MYVFSAVHIMLLPSQKPSSSLPSSSYSLLKCVYVTSQLRHSFVVHPLLRKILDPPLPVWSRPYAYRDQPWFQEAKPDTLQILQYPLKLAALCLRIYLDWVFTLEIKGFPEEKEANKVYCGGYANWELSLSYDVTAAMLVCQRMKTGAMLVVLKDPLWVEQFFFCKSFPLF